MTGQHLVQAALAAGALLAAVLPLLGVAWLAERLRDRRRTVAADAGAAGTCLCGAPLARAADVECGVCREIGQFI